MRVITKQKKLWFFPNIVLMGFRPGGKLVMGYYKSLNGPSSRFKNEKAQKEKVIWSTCDHLLTVGHDKSTIWVWRCPQYNAGEPIWSACLLAGQNCRRRRNINVMLEKSSQRRNINMMLETAPETLFRGQQSYLVTSEKHVQYDERIYFLNIIKTFK